MNRSYSKIRHIQEVNRNLESRMLVEQPGFYGGDPEWRTKGAQKDIQRLMNLDPHKVAMVTGFVSAFIPVVGPFLSAGIGLADAALYYKQGKKTEAGIVAAFSLLPGIGTVVSKIPAVKQLGASGMSALAGKILNKQALTATELAAAEGIAANGAIVQQGLSNTARSLAQTAAPKVAQEGEKQILKHVAKKGLEKGLEKGVEHASLEVAGGHVNPSIKRASNILQGAKTGLNQFRIG